MVSGPMTITLRLPLSSAAGVVPAIVKLVAAAAVCRNLRRETRRFMFPSGKSAIEGRQQDAAIVVSAAGGDQAKSQGLFLGWVQWKARRFIETVCPCCRG